MAKVEVVVQPVVEPAPVVMNQVGGSVGLRMISMSDVVAFQSKLQDLEAGKMKVVRDALVEVMGGKRQLEKIEGGKRCSLGTGLPSGSQFMLWAGQKYQVCNEAREVRDGLIKEAISARKVSEFQELPLAVRRGFYKTQTHDKKHADAKLKEWKDDATRIIKGVVAFTNNKASGVGISDDIDLDVLPNVLGLTAILKETSDPFIGTEPPAADGTPTDVPAARRDPTHYLIVERCQTTNSAGVGSLGFRIVPVSYRTANLCAEIRASLAMDKTKDGNRKFDDVFIDKFNEYPLPYGQLQPNQLGKAFAEIRKRRADWYNSPTA